MLEQMPVAASKLQAKLSPTRVVRTALGEMFSRPEADALSALATGALIGLVRHLAGRADIGAELSRTSIRQAQATLSMKGLSAPDAELVLSALQMTGFVRIVDDTVAIPLLDEAVNAESTALHNRMTGWVKRGARGHAAPPARQEHEQTPAATAAGQSAAAPATASELGGHPSTIAAVAATATASADPALGASSQATGQRPVPTAPRSATAGSRRRFEAGIEYCRFTSSEKKLTLAEEDPVVARIACKGDAVAEITADYAAELQQTFRGVDVDQELRKCRMWCESNVKLRKTFTGLRRFLNSWMTNALRDSQVRASVARGAQARNGFGQGGGYAQERADSGCESTGAARADSAALDDFADLNADCLWRSDANAGTSAPAESVSAHADETAQRAGSARASSDGPRVAPQRPQSSAVLAARARLLRRSSQSATL